MSELLHYEFFQNALMASLLSSIICAVIGVIIVQKKLLMMAGGIAHTAYGGVGLGYLCGFDPLLGAMGFSILGGVVIAKVSEKKLSNSDVIISMLWSCGMALGIAFIGFAPGYPPDMSTYLFGNILAVTKADLKLELILTCIVLFLFIMFYNDWRAFLFDEEGSFIRGIKTRFLSYLLMVMISLTVVVLIRIAGIILVISLLAVPASCSFLLSQKFNVRILLSAVFGALFCIGGLFISANFSIASGSSIVIISCLTYGIIYLFRYKKLE